MTKQELEQMLGALYDAMEAAKLDPTTLADASEEIHCMNVDDGIREFVDTQSDNAQELRHIQERQL